MVGDMMATLAELDERLAALQREMQAVQAAPSTAGRAPVPAVPPPAAQEPAQPPAGAVAQTPPPAPVAQLTLAELGRWRERLGRGVAELTTLITEVDTKLAGLATPPPAPPPQPTPRAAGAPGDAGGNRAPAAASSAMPVPTPHDRSFEGRVLVDAGPFADIAAVTTFQRALEQIPGARDVYVTGFDFNRAHVELELSDPVPLGREIRAVLPFNFAIFEAGRGRLAINVDAGSLTRWHEAEAQ